MRTEAHMNEGHCDDTDRLEQDNDGATRLAEQ